MSEMNEQRRDALPPGARLDANKYAIEEVLGSGGFGLVYRVRHLLLDEERAIKEYLPSEIAVRDGETVCQKWRSRERLSGRSASFSERSPATGAF